VLFGKTEQAVSRDFGENRHVGSGQEAVLLVLLLVLFKEKPSLNSDKNYLTED